MTDPVPLVVDGLDVSFGRGPAARRIVRDLSFTVQPGQIVALVGESGSGKSVTARSLVGLAGRDSCVSARRLSLGCRDLLSVPAAAWPTLRGREVGFVLQDALVSLDPLRPVGDEIAEALAVHGWGDRSSRRRRVLELLEQVGVPEPALRARQRPDQLSGGLRQRALIASALAMDPGLLIADEPTTALDATVAAQILDLFLAIAARGSAVLLISHDLTAVARIASNVVVMRDGAIQEQGPAGDVLGAPRHSYTRALLAAVPGTHPRGTRLSGVHRFGTGTLDTAISGSDPAEPLRSEPRPVSQDHAASLATLANRSGRPAPHRLPTQEVPLLEAIHLSKRYPDPDRTDRLVLDRVSFSLLPGRTLGIVGESGSGKTTAARIVLGLLEPDGGSVHFDGRAWTGAGPAAVSERERRSYRPAIGAIHQDPLGSFDPRWNVRRILADALEAGNVPREAHTVRIRALLDMVRLPAELIVRLPLNLSGGQRQRVAIARALATSPKLIVCDEPVSALDVSVQAQVLDLLADLQERLGVSFLFISHDLGVIRHVSDDIVVMRDGKVVETGPTEKVFADPRHPFTRELLAASLTRVAATGRGDARAAI